MIIRKTYLMYVQYITTKMSLIHRIELKLSYTGRNMLC
jgi:hypothetical protein